MKSYFAGAVSLGMMAGVALAQQAPPTENKGFSISQLGMFDLSKQGLKDLDQRQMRIRQIKLSGTLTEHFKGAPDRVYKAGGVIVESTDVEHWAENTGSEPVVLI